MRHEDRRLPDLPSQREELALQLDAGDRVQRAERLVEEQDRRVGRQRAGDADTLALAPGELTRVAGGELRGRQLDLLEQGVRAGADLLGGPAFQARHEADVLLDGEVREQARVLNDVADPPPETNRVPRHGGRAFHPHFARARQE